MAASSNATSLATTEIPSTNLSSLSTTNSSSLFSSPISTTKQPTNNNNKYFWSPTNNIESSLSTKDIVIQLRQLAQDPHQQIHLINNPESLRILSDTLVSTTTRSSIETCIISLQTLQLLATNPNYRTTLQSVPQLLPRIDNLCTLSSQQRVQTIAKNLKETITSKMTANKYQQYQPRPLHKIELTVINLNNDSDRDEIQTIAIKINGIISVTINMSSRECIFYTHRNSVRNSLIQSLRSNGFQVQTEEEKDFDDVASIHSGITNFTDQAQLSSLSVNKNTPGVNMNKPNVVNSIIQERYQNTLAVNGPSYPTPQQYSKTGITKYKEKQEFMSLQQRLENEKLLKEEEERKQQQTQSFLTKVISYIW